MLKNSVLSNNEDKIDFLVSEIESANAKISMLEGKITTPNDNNNST
jgi:hypothetical protein